MMCVDLSLVAPTYPTVGVFDRRVYWDQKYKSHLQLGKGPLLYMDVSKNRGTPKSSILIGFFIINHPFWGTSFFGNTHIGTHRMICRNPQRKLTRLFDDELFSTEGTLPLCAGLGTACHPLGSVETLGKCMAREASLSSLAFFVEKKERLSKIRFMIFWSKRFIIYSI